DCYSDSACCSGFVCYSACCSVCSSVADCRSVCCSDCSSYSGYFGNCYPFPVLLCFFIYDYYLLVKGTIFTNYFEKNCMGVILILIKNAKILPMCGKNIDNGC